MIYMSCTSRISRNTDRYQTCMSKNVEWSLTSNQSKNQSLMPVGRGKNREREKERKLFSSVLSVRKPCLKLSRGVVRTFTA